MILGQLAKNQHCACNITSFSYPDMFFLHRLMSFSIFVFSMFNLQREKKHVSWYIKVSGKELLSREKGALSWELNSQGSYRKTMVEAVGAENSPVKGGSQEKRQWRWLLPRLWSYKKPFFHLPKCKTFSNPEQNINSKYKFYSVFNTLSPF